MEISHQVLVGVFFIKVKTKLTVQGLIQRHTWTDMREQGIRLPLAVLLLRCSLVSGLSTATLSYKMSPYTHEKWSALQVPVQRERESKVAYSFSMPAVRR